MVEENIQKLKHEFSQLDNNLFNQIKEIKDKNYLPSKLFRKTQ